MAVLLIVLMSIYAMSIIGMMIAAEPINKMMFEISKCSLIALGTFCIICLITFHEPKAIDVYRGKTTLQVTYQDTVAIDSIVVFKNK